MGNVSSEKQKAGLLKRAVTGVSKEEFYYALVSIAFVPYLLTHVSDTFKSNID
jgi:hypothetical protein